MELFNRVKEWCVRLREGFFWNLFIFGPKYSVAGRDHIVLLNFLFGSVAVTEKQNGRVRN